MKPTIHLTNFANRKFHRGAVYSIMARPRTWEHGAGRVPALTPRAEDFDAWKGGRLEGRTYRRRFEADLILNLWDLVPGSLGATNGHGPGATHWPVVDGDTLCCGCSRAAAARGECHRAWAAEALLQAGWAVVLDGVVLPDDWRCP